MFSSTDPSQEIGSLFIRKTTGDFCRYLISDFTILRCCRSVQILGQFTCDKMMEQSYKNITQLEVGHMHVDTMDVTPPRSPNSKRGKLNS